MFWDFELRWLVDITKWLMDKDSPTYFLLLPTSKIIDITINQIENSIQTPHMRKYVEFIKWHKKNWGFIFHIVWV